MQIYSDKIFNNPISIIEAFDNKTFFEAFEEINKYKKNNYLIGYIRYEAKEIFLNRQIKTKLPLLYFEVYENYNKFKNGIIKEIPFIYIKNSISKQKYISNIKKIKRHIENGNTYEVNYTYPVNIFTNQDDFNLFIGLLNEQKTKYTAFINNKYETIISYSPELFFRIENNKITTKPMKGTIKRGKTSEEDIKNIEFLKNDIKNRSENIMIVDLIRNDLSKISKTGSVKVNKLFEIEEYKTLFQMTSEISAELKEDITLYEIFNALFPCGSITGAPKISTMNIIDELENYNREVYTGAIGIITPKYTEFSVPIRILQRKTDEDHYKYAQGGAIVWDSEANEEYEETITKRKFLNDNTDFQLIETMKVQDLDIFLFNEHIQRLKKSCKFFNFKFPFEIENLIPEKNGILRLLVYKDGEYSVEYKELKENKSNYITIAEKKVYSKNIFLKHKTTIRDIFNETTKKIQNGEVFDEIYFNEKGEITEGSRSNILIEKNNIFYTPYLKSGLLNGTMRSYLLKQNKIKEKILYMNDLLSADNIYCINSIRGIVKVNLK